MSFRVIITENSIKARGEATELLAGLSLYIEALRGNDIPDDIINFAIKLGFENKEDRSTNVINNLSNLPEEKLKELLDKLFD